MKVLSLLYVASLATAFPFSFSKRANETCPASSCGVLGWEMHLPGHDAEQYWISRETIYTTNNACGKHCAADEECKTYAIGEGSCRHYRKTINETMLRLPSADNGSFAFYVKTCQNCPNLNMTSIAPYANRTSQASQPSVTSVNVHTKEPAPPNHGIFTPEPYRPGSYWSSVHHVHPSPSSIQHAVPTHSQGPFYPSNPHPHAGNPPQHSGQNSHDSDHGAYVKVPPKGASSSILSTFPTTTARYMKPSPHAVVSPAPGYSAKPKAPPSSIETVVTSYPVPGVVPSSATATPEYPKFTPIFTNATSTSGYITDAVSSTVQLPSVISTPSFPFSNSSSTAASQPSNYVGPVLPIASYA